MDGKLGDVGDDGGALVQGYDLISVGVDDVGGSEVEFRFPLFCFGR